MTRPASQRAIAILLLTSTAGCSTFSHVNRPLSPAGRRATFELRDPRGAPEVLVLLALSGGGSRAAVFAASVLEELDRDADPSNDAHVNLLQEVDGVSSVSGGSVTAAYYALSADDDERFSAVLRSEPLPSDAPPEEYDPQSGRLTITGAPSAEAAERLRNRYYGDLPTVNRLIETARRGSQAKLQWSRRNVREAMATDYQTRWLLRHLSPWRLGKLVFTAYDRSDVMAEVFDGTFKRATFADLNPERPYLFINAADATSAHGRERDLFRRFVFTEETISEETKSELSSLPVSRAVMASAAFPGAFAYVTLKNYNGEGRYVHLFDGGNHDNLGLETVKEIIVRNQERFDSIAVISIDADISVGEPEAEAGGGGIVDTVMTSVSSLLLRSRRVLLDEFRKGKLQYGGDPVQLPGEFKFCHLSLDHLPPGRLRDDVYAIATEFRISRAQTRDLRRAADDLVSETNRKCLDEIRDLIRRSRERREEAAASAVTLTFLGSGRDPCKAPPLADTEASGTPAPNANDNRGSAGVASPSDDASDKDETEIRTPQDERNLHAAALADARSRARKGNLDDAADAYWSWWERDQEHSPATLQEVAFVQIASADTSPDPERKRALYSRAISLLRQPEKQLRQLVPASEGSRLMTNNLAIAHYCRAESGDYDPRDERDDYRNAARAFANLLASYSQSGAPSDGAARLRNLVGLSAPQQANDFFVQNETALCEGEDRRRVCDLVEIAVKEWTKRHDELQPKADASAPNTGTDG